MVGFTLLKDDDVIFLEKENKVLNNEEKQTIVILFLLTDLWMEKGKAYNDLFVLYNPWTELDWFRDGYGKEYLHQVGLEENDLAIIEDIFKKLERKGIVSYRVDTQTILLRRPAERIINLARKIYNQMKAKDSSGDE